MAGRNTPSLAVRKVKTRAAAPTAPLDAFRVAVIDIEILKLTLLLVLNGLRRESFALSV
jgi:hypothetical protein